MLKTTLFLTAFELKMASNFHGSPLTARRRLRERGIRCRRTATKEYLKIDHIVDRLAYATTRQDFDWRNVIFSDEVVVFSDNYGPPRVYRIDGHRYHERFVARLCMSGRVSVGGWISYDGAGTLERIHGRFTVDTYIQILTNVMVPSARELYPEGLFIYFLHTFCLFILHIFRRFEEVKLLFLYTGQVMPNNSPRMMSNNKFAKLA